MRAMHFGRSFRKIRKAKNIAQKIIAIDTGYTTAYVSYVEWNTATPHRKTSDLFCKALGVSFAAVMLNALTDEDVPEQFRDEINSLKQRMLL